MPNEIIRRQNMQTVLRQAMKLFVANGVENTSVELIARESGLTLRSVQNYYHTKNDLIAAVLECGCAAEIAEMKAFFSSPQYLSKTGAEQILMIVTVAFRKAVDMADVVVCSAQMQRLLSRASKTSEKPQMAENWKLITEHVESAFARGIQDGSITKSMETSLIDARSITLAMYGIKEQVAFAMCGEELRGLFDPEAAVEKYIRQMKLLLSVK